MDLCRKGRNVETVDQFYPPRIVSIESSGSPEMPAEMTGSMRFEESVSDDLQAYRPAQKRDRDGVVYGEGRENCPFLVTISSSASASVVHPSSAL